MLVGQILRFIGIGIVNTLFGYSAYALLLYVGLGYVSALIIATILGVAFNFRTIGALVFGVNNSNLILRFIFVYVVVFTVNLLLLIILANVGIDAYLAGALAILPCATISFILNKYFVFKR